MSRRNKAWLDQVAGQLGASAPKDVHYGGAWLRYKGAHGWSIEKDGAHIGWASSVEEGKRTIDQVYGTNPRARRNLAPRGSRELRQAGRLFADFTGHDPRIGERLDASRALGLPIQPGRKIPLVAFAELLEVKDRTIRDGKEEFYRHPFRASSRPLLAARHDGKRLYIVGGRYRFTDRGIVDQ